MGSEAPTGLLAAIEAAFSAHPRLAIEGLTLSQNTETGAVTVSGLVPDIRTKRLAANVVWEVVRGRPTVFKGAKERNFIQI